MGNEADQLSEYEALRDRLRVFDSWFGADWITRCDHCGWPLVDEGGAGCRESNCSRRPVPHEARTEPRKAVRSLLAQVRALTRERDEAQTAGGTLYASLRWASDGTYDIRRSATYAKLTIERHEEEERSMNETIRALRTERDEARAEVARLRGILLDAIPPLEVLYGQHKLKPYVELSPELLASVERAVIAIRERVAALSQARSADLPSDAEQDGGGT